MTDAAVASVSTSRVRHWKRDGADIYIGRPGPWGNPFRLDGEDGREAVIARYRAWLEAQPHLQRMARRELAGKTLGCWCAPRLCHGDVLAEFAADGGPSADPVFVFGSNLRGVPGAGAALFASQHRGFATGVESGRSGNAYGIPTKDAHLATRPLEAIREDVAAFLAYAGEHAHESFEVTRVGCGLAGYKNAQIAPFFSAAPANVDVPYVWRRLLGEELPPRVIVAGSRTFTDQPRMDAALTKILSRMADAIIVSGAAKGADTMGETYALGRWAHRPVPFLRYPAEWDRYGKRAGMIRNQQMARVASHLVAFWNGSSPGTKAMIDMAKESGLAVRVVSVE